MDIKLPQGLGRGDLDLCAVLCALKQCHLCVGHCLSAGIWQATWVSLLSVGPWWLVFPRWLDPLHLLLALHMLLRPAGILIYSHTRWFALWSLATFLEIHQESLHGAHGNLWIPSMPHGSWGKLWGAISELLSSNHTVFPLKLFYISEEVVLGWDFFLESQ